VHQADLSLSRSFAGFSGGIEGGWRVTDNFDAPGHSEVRVCGASFGIPCEFIFPGSALGCRYSREETFERPSTNDSISQSGMTTLSIRLPFPLTASLAYGIQEVNRRIAQGDTLIHTGRFEMQYTFEGNRRAWISISIEVRDNGFDAPGQDYQEQIYSLRGFFEY
jgi:hypothetical protein